MVEINLHQTEIFLEAIQKNYHQIINDIIFKKLLMRETHNMNLYYVTNCYSKFFVYIFYMQMSEKAIQSMLQGVIKKEEDQEKKNKCFDKWKISQDLKYAQFIQQNEQKLSTEHLRRISRIFVVMAESIGSKNAEQCRTHHQKMIKGYHSVSSILEHIQNKKKRHDKRQLRRGKRGRPRKNRSLETGSKFQEKKIETKEHLKNYQFRIVSRYQSQIESPCLPTSEIYQPQSLKKNIKIPNIETVIIVDFDKFEWGMI